LVAAEYEGGRAPQIARLRDALQALLARHSPLPFAAVKPLLVSELGRAFEPTRFGCENTGDFLRSFAQELDIDIQSGASDWEVRPRSADSAATGDGALTPATPESRVESALVVAARPQGSAHEHCVSSYHKLLRYRRPNLHTLPRTEFDTITAVLYGLAFDSNGARKTVEHQKLLDTATALCEPYGFELVYHKINGLLFQMFKSGCFVCDAQGQDKGRTEFHWGQPARLADDIESIDALRLRLRKFVVDALKERLESVGVHTPIDPKVLAELFDGPTPSREIVEQLTQLAQAPKLCVPIPVVRSQPAFAAEID
jgi:hypothetical protein